MKHISGWHMAVIAMALTGCAAMADALHGNPAPRAVTFQPSCFFLCFASTTATYTRGDEYAPGTPASSTTSTTSTTDHH